MQQVYAKNETGQNWLVLFIISSAYIAVVTNIQGFKAMLPLVEAEFAISGAQAGFYASFYFLSATLIALFSGKIVDRLGPRKGLIYGVATVGAMILLHSFAPVFGVILGLAFFTGVGFSIITPSVNKGVLEEVEPNKRALSMGITHSGGGIGALLGSSLMPFLGELWGWRTALLLAGSFALLVSLFIMKFYRRRPERQEETTLRSGESPAAKNQTSSANSSSDTSMASLKQDLLFLLKDRYLLSICLAGLIFGISLSSITAHFALFLSQDLNYSAGLAGLGLFFFNLGGVVAQPGWGFINDRWLGGDRRKGLFILGVLSSVVLLWFGLVISQGGLSFNGVIFSSILLGLFVLGIPGLYFTAVSEQVPSHKTGVATSLALIFSRVGVIFFPPLFGFLADQTGNYIFSWNLLGFTVMAITVVFYLSTGYYRKTRDPVIG